MYTKQEREFIAFLVKAVPTQSKLLLAHLTKRQVSALREVVINVLRGGITLTSDQLKQLRKHKTFYRLFAEGCKVRLLQKPLVLLLAIALPRIQQL
jgi:hypothetical protein